MELFKGNHSDISLLAKRNSNSMALGLIEKLSQFAIQFLGCNVIKRASLSKAESRALLPCVNKCFAINLSKATRHY